MFPAGNDLGDFAKTPASTTESPAFAFMRSLATFPKPLLAAVCGQAVHGATAAFAPDTTGVP